MVGNVCKILPSYTNQIKQIKENTTMTTTIQNILETKIEELEEEFAFLESSMADMLSDHIEYDDEDWDHVYNASCVVEDRLVSLTLELEAIK